MQNTCWTCEHNVLKIKLLVPQNHTIREYVQKTGNFQSDIVAIVKEKQGEYTIWYHSEGELKLTTFKMLHVCQFKLEKSEENTCCPNYKMNETKNRISNIIYSKQASLIVI